MLGAHLGPIFRPMVMQRVDPALARVYFILTGNKNRSTDVQSPIATPTQYEDNSVFTKPDQGGSKWISASTRGSCWHHRFRGEGLYMILVPSSPQIFYLTTITTTHSWTKTQKIPRSALQISWAEARGWCDAAGEAQTSYSGVLSTSVLSYGRHFTPSKPSCLGICFVSAELALSQLCYVGKGLKIIFEKIWALLCVRAWEKSFLSPQISLCCLSELPSCCCGIAF